MTTQAQMTENLFRNWKNIDKRVKYLRAREMSESADGEVDYKASYFKCLEERDIARRDYEVMYKLCRGAEKDRGCFMSALKMIADHHIESHEDGLEMRSIAIEALQGY